MLLLLASNGMKVRFAKPFENNFKKLPIVVRKKFEKQLGFLLKNIRHPSLHAKKYDETQDVWQARVNGGYRFYFVIEDDAYVILNIGKHP